MITTLKYSIILSLFWNLQQQQSFYGPLSETTWWADTRRNIHPHTILIIIQSLSASSIYYDTQHPPRSKCMLGNLFCTTSLHILWSPPPHIPYIFTLCLLFATHAHTISTCFAVASRLHQSFSQSHLCSQKCHLITARRFASSVLATAILSVRPSVTHRYCVKMACSTVQFAPSGSKIFV